MEKNEKCDNKDEEEVTISAVFVNGFTIYTLDRDTVWTVPINQNGRQPSKSHNRAFDLKTHKFYNYNFAIVFYLFWSGQKTFFLNGPAFYKGHFQLLCFKDSVVSLGLNGISNKFEQILEFFITRHLKWLVCIAQNDIEIELKAVSKFEFSTNLS